MCSVRPIYEFEVTPQRFDAALAAITAARMRLTNDQAYEVMLELGWGDALVGMLNTDETEAPLQLSLTSVQFVALAAAIAAVAENGGKQHFTEIPNIAEAIVP